MLIFGRVPMISWQPQAIEHGTYDSHDTRPRSSCWRQGFKALSEQGIFARFYTDCFLIASLMAVRSKGLSRETNKKYEAPSNPKPGPTAPKPGSEDLERFRFRGLRVYDSYGSKASVAGYISPRSTGQYKW